ncbi:MAG: GIY-YIG nuclease family protein [Ignavibacteriae bacterium]|nr:GIY-YIG nuclease family protein [Ignavibacteriota bacterium]
MFTVYVLKSLKDGKNYTGYTVDIERRLKEHNGGKTESTKRRRPFVLIYTEEYVTEDDAKQRERYLTSGKGREELKNILTGAVPKW